MTSGWGIRVGQPTNERRRRMLLIHPFILLIAAAGRFLINGLARGGMLW